MLRLFGGLTLAGITCLIVLGVIGTIPAIGVPRAMVHSFEPVNEVNVSPQNVVIHQPVEPVGIWNGNLLYDDGFYRDSRSMPFIPTMSVLEWIVILAVGLIVLRIMLGLLRRGKPTRVVAETTDGPPPSELAKYRREAELVNRMHHVMDRLETRVESLESALLLSRN